MSETFNLTRYVVDPVGRSGSDYETVAQIKEIFERANILNIVIELPALFGKQRVAVITPKEVLIYSKFQQSVDDAVYLSPA